MRIFVFLVACSSLLDRDAIILIVPAVSAKEAKEKAGVLCQRKGLKEFIDGAMLDGIFCLGAIEMHDLLKESVEGVAFALGLIPDDFNSDPLVQEEEINGRINEWTQNITWMD